MLTFQLTELGAGGNPCPNCMKHREDCFYNLRRRRQKPGDGGVDPATTAQKSAPLEEPLRTARQPSIIGAGSRAPLRSESFSVQGASPYEAMLPQFLNRTAQKSSSQVNERRLGGLISSTFGTDHSQSSMCESTPLESLQQSHSPNDASITLASATNLHTADENRPWEPRNLTTQASSGVEPLQSYPTVGSLTRSLVEDQEGSSVYSASTVS